MAGFNFERWASLTDLTEATRTTLREACMTTSYILVGASEDDLKELDLRIGERVCLRGAIKQLREEPRKFWESENYLDSPTSPVGQGKGSC